MSEDDESREPLIDSLKRQVDVVDEILRLRQHLTLIDEKIRSLEEAVRGVKEALESGRTAQLSPCDYARERHQNLARWRNLWTILLFAFGVAVVTFLIAAILLFIRASWLPGALSTLGIIVSGVGISWVLARRTDAVTEEEEAYKDVAEKCRDSRVADDVRKKAVLLFGIR